MAYLVVIRFEDDEKRSAQALADRYQDYEMLVGAYKVQDEDTPTCECWGPGELPSNAQHLKDNQLLKRNPQTGWYECPQCGLPRKGAFQNVFNLRDTDPERKLVLSYGSVSGHVPLHIARNYARKGK